MLGKMTSGYFTIDPDETGPLNPFPVWCDFSTIPATTLIHHDRYILNTNFLSAKQSILCKITAKIPELCNPVKCTLLVKKYIHHSN